MYFLLSVGSVMSIELNRIMIPGNQLPVPKKKNRSSGCYPFRCEAFSSSSFFLSSSASSSSSSLSMTFIKIPSYVLPSLELS